MLADKTMCFEKGFNSYYDFFKQASECLRVSWFLYYLQLVKLSKYSIVLIFGFIKSRRDLVSLLAGAVLFVLMLTVNPFNVSHEAKLVLAVAVLMITWWVTEAIPMPVVAMLPLILFPLMGIASIKDTSASYGDNIIFLFLGGFMIGLAIEKWNLHTRIALFIIRATGTSGDRIVLGFIIATGFFKHVAQQYSNNNDDVSDCRIHHSCCQ